MGCGPPPCCQCAFNPYNAVPDCEYDPAVSEGGSAPVQFESLPPVADKHGSIVSAPQQVHISQPQTSQRHRRDPGAQQVYQERKSAETKLRFEEVCEEAVLARSSNVYGRRIPPWTKADEQMTAHLELGDGDQDLFEDPDGPLRLSDPQTKAVHAWRRLSDRSQRGGSARAPAVFSGPPTWRDIRQGLVSDCSLMSALSVLADYEQRFGGTLLRTIIFPQSGDAQPAFSARGEYACRLFLNGCMRKVVIDDVVPIGRAGKLLCSHSARDEELWVSLLEKATAKIMGGSYDMRGSNPGVDVFHLTGWLPESIDLSNDNQEVSCDRAAKIPETVGDYSADELFITASQGFAEGRCVVCVGTSQISDAAELAEVRSLGYMEGVSRSTGLVAGHAYPVLDFRQLQGHRLLFLKNPWGRVRWTGRFSPQDSAWLQNISLADEMRYDVAQAAVDDGCFWIEWEDILRHFSHMYVCWSPSASGWHRMQAHGSWTSPPPAADGEACAAGDLIAFSPQFHLHLEQPLPQDPAVGVWVLLSRHITKPADVRAQYINVSIYRSSSALIYPDSLVVQGVFSNGECAIAKLRAADVGQDRDFVIVVSQHDANISFTFSLHVYTTAPGTLVRSPPLIPQGCATRTGQGQWTQRSAGGCSNDLWSYFQNPQWCLEVPDGGVTDVVVLMTCPANHTVNARLFARGVALPDGLLDAWSSGPYRRGGCMLRRPELAAGRYVVVVSTFAAGLCGEYSLTYFASRPLTMTPQPHPFVGGPAPPLQCTVRIMQRGQAASLRICASKAEGRRIRISARLQTEPRRGQLPALALWQWRGSKQPMQYEELKPTDATVYFDRVGAVVIVLACLQPDVVYLLEAALPAPAGKRGSDGKLYIFSDGRITVGNGADLVA